MDTLFREINSSLNLYQPVLDFTAYEFLKIDYLR